MVALFAATTLVACTDKPNVPGTGGLQISTKEVNVSEIGGEYTIVLTSPGAWKATVNMEAKEWLSVPATSGSGGSGMEVIIKVAPLKEGQTTEGVVTFALASGEGQISAKFIRGKAAYGRSGDSTVLVELYNATQGKTWRVRWDFSAPINTWDSITTEVIDGQLRVTEIRLNNVNVSSSRKPSEYKPLPEQFGYLSELRVLDLGQAERDHTTSGVYKITGKLPVSMGEIKTLRKVNLAYNQFDGPIPAGLLDNENIEILDLQLNKLSGEVPAMDNAKALKTLRLNGNKLSGIIPASLSGLVNLEMVDLARNAFTGAIPSFNAMKKLRHLDISNNATYAEQTQEAVDQVGFGYYTYVSGGLDGTVALDGLSELSYVNLAGCCLKASPKVTNCPQIKDLYLSNNAVGALDASIFNLPSCQNLYLDNAGITTLPEITDLSNAKTLKLQDNPITTIPESLKKATKLVALDLCRTECEVLPDIFGEMTLMEDFQMAYSKNKDAKYRGKLKSIPASVWTMPALKVLCIHMNNIESQLPARLPAFTKNMVIFNLSFNKFTGSIHAVGDLARAEWILLSVNGFTGTLPENMGDLQQVNSFAVDDNYLTGSLPVSVIKCPRIENLHLLENNFDGVIPYEVWNDKRFSDTWHGHTHIVPQRDGKKFQLETKPVTSSVVR